MSLFDKHPQPYPVRVLRGVCDKVTDADTYVIEADLGFHVSATVPVRLLGVNAPEMSTPEGRLAKAEVVKLIEGKPVLLTPYKDRQTFARWLGVVQFWVPPLPGDLGTWQDLGEWLVTRRLAVRT